jgi:lactoylglutathione lyase
MGSKTEQIISRSLRAILANLPNGANTKDSEPFRREVLSALAWGLPGVIAEIHPEWNNLTLDGVYAAVVKKTADGEAEIFGQCIFIDDQTLTPIYLRLQIDPTTDENSWLKCKVGEAGEHGMIRGPYSSLNSNFKQLYQMDMDGNLDGIDWVYSVTFGQRRPFLTLVVLRTRMVDRLLTFYRTLGVEFVEERHGNGPLHCAAKTGGVVFEVYPASDDSHVDATTRLGFTVMNLNDVLAAIQAGGAPLVKAPQTTEWGYRAVVRDPDGRAIELCQG